MGSGERLITTAQAADLLGVRVQTIYAYVSRGLLERVGNGPRRGGSSFRLSQVRSLAARHDRPRSSTFQLSVDTAITSMNPAGALRFRGRDAVGLAEHATYEETADLLWQTPGADWTIDAATRETARRAAEFCDVRALPSDRVRIVCGLLASTSGSTGDDAHDAHQMLLAAVEAACAPSADEDVASRMCVALTRPEGRLEPDIVQAAMVLLADHELATSSVAARAAAGTGASLSHAVCAGLFAMAGPRHGQASVGAERLLDHVRAIGVDDALDEFDSPPPGFGHTIYRDVDPRAEHLFARLSTLRDTGVPLVDDLALAVFRRWQVVPNVDLALAAMAHDLGLHPGSGEVLFTVSRIAGLAAHVMEERGHPLRFRPRALYTGPE